MRSIKIKISLIILLLIAILIVFQWFFVNYFIKETLEKDLINYITNVGKTIREGIAPSDIQTFPGFKDSNIYKKLEKELEDYKRTFNIDNMIIINPFNRVIIDVSGEFYNGDEYMFIDINQRQIESLKLGIVEKSFALYKDKFGRYVENVYLPIFDENKQFVGMLILKASVEYFKTLVIFQRKLFYLFLVLIFFSIILSFLFSISISKPVIKLTGVVEDIGRGSMETDIPYKKKHDEIGVLAKNISEMRLKIKTRDLYLRKISAGIAHEIRNPITAILGNLMILKRKIKDDPTLIEIIDDNISQINALEQLVTDFMNFARPASFQFKQISFKDLLEKSLQEVELIAKQKEVKMDHSPCDFELSGDFNFLKRAFVNILKNGIEAVKLGGSVSVSVIKEKRNIKIIFADNGKGIKEEEMESIFEPFYTTKETGTGLGLSIVKEIIEKHNMKIMIGSKENEFTHIIITVNTEA